MLSGCFETVEKQLSCSSTGQSPEEFHGIQRTPLAFVPLWNHWIEKDGSGLTPGWFLWPEWPNSAFSSQWKLRVLLFKSPPCVSFGASAHPGEESAITWLYGTIQSWYITHGLEKIHFLPVSDDHQFMNKTLKCTFCASQPQFLSCSSRLDLTAQCLSVLANYHVAL